MTLKLVGNLTRDLVFRCAAFPIEGQSNSARLQYERAGGVGNITPLLTMPHIVYATEPSTAIIIFNGSNKTSLVDWHDKIQNPNYVNTNWAHISYLDKVDVEPGTLNSQYVSADLCSSAYTNEESDALLSKLKQIDYLIISHSEATGLTSAHIAAVKKAVIIRGIADIEIISKHGINKYPNIYINVGDTLGAGDAFVAEFLNQVHECGFYAKNAEALMKDCIESSLKYLRNKNEKI
jgi:pfkB family carbohydrate kinase